MSTNIFSVFDDDKLNKEFPDVDLTREDVERMKLVHPSSVSPNNKPILQDQIITEIAAATQTNKYVVEAVLKAFTDLFIREVVTRGCFRWTNLISVSTYIQQGRQGYLDEAGAIIQYPSSFRLRVSIPKKVRSLFRWARRHEQNKKNRTDINNWWKPFVLKKVEKEKYDEIMR